MTEEIIKDCVFCENGRTCNIYPWTCDYDGYCSSNKECPIKEMIVKLKRLEQENNAYKQSEQEAIEIIAELKQENKELKKFFDSAAKKNTSLENKIKEYREQYDELYWTTDQLVKDKTKLKQTLEEIRGYCTGCENGVNARKIKEYINEVLR